MEDTLFVWQDHAKPFLPQYEPYNKAAHTILNRVTSTLSGYPSSPSATAKWDVVVSSMLAAIQSAAYASDNITSISVNMGGDTYSHYPATGRTIIKKVITAMEDAGWITKVEGSGTRTFKGDPNKFMIYDIPTLYGFNDSILKEEGFVEAEWLEAYRPLVLVSKAPKKGEEWHHKHYKQARPKHTAKYCKKHFPKAYLNAERKMRKLNAFLAEHPMCVSIPTREGEYKRYTASTTRVYQNSSIRKGGRYYGLWSNIGSGLRKHITIDGEPTAHIDITASQPTLLSALHGEKMNIGDDTWTDVYQVIAERLRSSEDPDVLRNKVKSVIMETIGSGKLRDKPAKDNKFTFKDGEYDLITMCCVSVIPSLQHLTPNKIDGANYLSYHEANMVEDALTTLMAMNVPAYPMHDALICKQSDVGIVLQTLTNSISSYVKKHTKGFTFTPSLTIDGLNLEKVKTQGLYLAS